MIFHHIHHSVNTQGEAFMLSVCVHQGLGVLWTILEFHLLHGSRSVCKIFVALHIIKRGKKLLCDMCALTMVNFTWALWSWKITMAKKSFHTLCSRKQVTAKKFFSSTSLFGIFFRFPMKTVISDDLDKMKGHLSCLPIIRPVKDPPKFLFFAS